MCRISQRGERIGTNRYYWCLFDGLGSVVSLVDSSGTVVHAYKYESYGRVVAITGTVANPCGFAGGYTDRLDPKNKNTWLVKLGTRYYFPLIGCFTQMDPERGQPSDPLSLNRYLYAGCNPANLRTLPGEASSALSPTLFHCGASCGIGISLCSCHPADFAAVYRQARPRQQRHDRTTGGRQKSFGPARL